MLTFYILVTRYKRTDGVIIDHSVQKQFKSASDALAYLDEWFRPESVVEYEVAKCTWEDVVVSRRSFE